MRLCVFVNVCGGRRGGDKVFSMSIHLFALVCAYRCFSFAYARSHSDTSLSQAQWNYATLVLTVDVKGRRQ